MTRARYTVEHETLYRYAAPVSQSWQRLLAYRLTIDPTADESHEAADSFGNTVTHFGLHRAHRLLRVILRCAVEVGARPALGGAAAGAEPWETVHDAVRRQPAQDGLAPARLVEPTRLVPLSDAAQAYAAAHLAPGRDWLEALTALMHAIHRDFTFEPGATTVSTSVDEVLQQRSGVCQDFAHLMLACLRGHGLPARYVSGYLLTRPPPGKPRLLGVDATHAWVAAYLPRHGWVEFDPTNDQFADLRYITLAWGADFADVVPLRGVMIGGGEQSLDVSVSVIPEHEETAAPR